jgi:hypothetical protein
VKVFEKDPATGVKHMRSVLDITKDLANSKLAKDPTKLEKALGRVEAYRAFLQLRDNRAELDKLVESASDAGVIQRDLDKYSQSSAGRTKIAWQKAKNEIAEAFTPERIDSFTTAMVAATKVAATLATSVSKVIGGIEDVAKGFAMLIGGKTEEDKATEMQAAHIKERQKGIIAQMRKEAPDAEHEARRQQVMRFGGPEAAAQLDEAWYGDRPSQRMGQEDALAKQLAAGERLGYRKTRPAQYSTPRFPGDESVMTSMERPGGYDMEELLSLRKQFQDSGMTNTQGMVNIVDDLMKKLEKNQTDFLQRFGSQQPVFKIGADPIMTATKGAPQNARRPGG